MAVEHLADRAIGVHPPFVARADLDGSLAEAYEHCRELHRRHGRSYYLATRLLPASKRRYVHALYGFTRWADEIVDAAGGEAPERRARRLETWREALHAGLRGEPVDQPLLAAVVDTIRRFDLDPGEFDTFMDSMAMDVTVGEYRTYHDLLGYMEGSAAAIGTMMVPILGAAGGWSVADAREPARQLGFAFQLTNFIRDVAEDLGRGRIYLPLEDLARFGLTPAALHAAAARGRASAPVKALIAYECVRARRHYAAAAPGIAMLPWRSRICIRAAYRLYGGILDEVARAGYDVFAGRVRVPRRRRLLALLASARQRLPASLTGG